MKRSRLKTKWRRFNYIDNAMAVALKRGKRPYNLGVYYKEWTRRLKLLSSDTWREVWLIRCVGGGEYAWFAYTWEGDTPTGQSDRWGYR
jgi:hypothetical protein